ncbi:DMT family transporter [Roseateles asaccharophilus]|uniref:Drug/metabolite transporter (DMT)-like permease n=1 Tax=Roseateles asaccharophilus TaxID=582607 RepID=A0ABU2ADN8_9BURK|nr:DMT family transporter [Roseateles asaccharophilus]MDR7335314.1 drug/metabolite transporter (DMT)-like permease [Roseateles asaccharophilus]
MSSLVTPSPAPLDGRASGLMLLLCLTWGLQQISLKTVADVASPMLMVALRSGIAALLLALLMGRRGERLARERWALGAAAGALFALEYLLVSQALQWTQASHVVVFLYSAPLFAALGLHWRLPAERLGVRQWGGIALAFGGIVVAFLGGEPQNSSSLWGDLLALGAALCWAATTITIRCTRLADAPATETLQYQLLGAFALLLPATALTGQWQFDAASVRVWAHLGFQALVVSFASFLAWCWLLRHYLASRLGVFSFLTPLFGVLLGAWLLGERLEPAFIAGSAAVLAGIVAVSLRAVAPAPSRHRVRERGLVLGAGSAAGLARFTSVCRRRFNVRLSTFTSVRVGKGTGSTGAASSISASRDQ